MQSTSELYNTILTGGSYNVQSKVRIDGTDYAESELFSVKTVSQVFPDGKLSVGNCISREIDIEMKIPNVTFSRMASIQPFQRITNGTQTSEWIPKGKFFIDTRDVDQQSGRLTLHGYDSIMLAEADYPSTTHKWPTDDIVVVREVASKIGVQLDARTTGIIKNGYTVQFPGAYTMRETLGYIAAMYGGNFIMSDEGKLLLLPLSNVTDLSGFLVTQNGDYLLIGGDRIFV